MRRSIEGLISLQVSSRLVFLRNICYFVLDFVYKVNRTNSTVIVGP